MGFWGFGVALLLRIDCRIENVDDSISLGNLNGLAKFYCLLRYDPASLSSPPASVFVNSD